MGTSECTFWATNHDMGYLWVKRQTCSWASPIYSEGATLLGLGTFPFRAGGECCVYGVLILHSDNFPFNQRHVNWFKVGL